MSIAALRDENEQLKALLAQTQAALSEHQGALAASEEARRRLEVILGELRRDKFGAKSEKLRPDQYHLPLEDVEIAQGILDAAQERAEKVIQGRSRNATDQSSHRNRGCLPAHLPRVERIIEPASTLCPCGCGAMTKIGEDVSKRLDVIPAQWRVLVTRRPKYICRRCSGPVVQAHAPEHVVPSGLPTEAAIAHVIVSKFGDHTPFYRQSEIYARQGIRLDRATLGNWSGRACFHLQRPSRTTCATTWPCRIGCSWTRPRRQYSIRGAAKRRRATSGRSPQTTAATVVQVRRSCCSDMPPVAAVPLLSSS